MTEPDAPRPLDPTLVAEGKEIFRFDTFGDETFWTDTLRMHEVIQGGVSPATALSVGLKVDADALPQAVKDALAAGQVDLNDPATTVTLLKLGAVVTRSGGVLSMSMPSLGSANRPWPCIWVMATYAFQYETVSSPVYSSRRTFRSPNAGGSTTG